jgi:antitoxin (DNA-binding transcriptional repressor) of toxin-antitoxin stability system
MCYMATGRKTEVPVGVRELRQNLSVYLARLASGTVFRVTDRGRAVALLIPLPQHATTVERLVGAGRAQPATRDLVALGPPTARTKRSLSSALRSVRADRL